MGNIGANDEVAAPVGRLQPEPPSPVAVALSNSRVTGVLHVTGFGLL